MFAVTTKCTCKLEIVADGLFTTYTAYAQGKFRPHDCQRFLLREKDFQLDVPYNSTDKSVHLKRLGSLIKSTDSKFDSLRIKDSSAWGAMTLCYDGRTENVLLQSVMPAADRLYFVFLVDPELGGEDQDRHETRTLEAPFLDSSGTITLHVYLSQHDWENYTIVWKNGRLESLTRIDNYSGKKSTYVPDYLSGVDTPRPILSPDELYCNITVCDGAKRE